MRSKGCERSHQLKELLAELMLENRLLKKSVLADGESDTRQALSSDDSGQDRTLPRSMKNQILLENYYLPGQLEARLAEFVDYYNSRRYHESLNNLTRPTSTSAVVQRFCHGGRMSN
jgi:transposase InsO family protein